MSRHNIDPKYEWSIIKEYDHWTLLLYEKATSHLGRAVVWLAREGEMQRYSQLSTEELVELQRVLKEYELALEALWKPDHMNYMWLGNFFHEHGGHGHMHVLPRYKTPRIVDGVTYEDKKYGGFHYPYEVLGASRGHMERLLGIIRGEMGSEGR